MFIIKDMKNNKYVGENLSFTTNINKAHIDYYKIHAMWVINDYYYFNPRSKRKLKIVKAEVIECK